MQACLRQFTLSFIAVACGASIASAQAESNPQRMAKPNSPSPAPGIRALSLPSPEDSVRFDSPSKGVERVAAARFEAEFSTAGTRYTPFFGSSAARAYPFHLKLISVNLGTKPVAFAADVPPVSSSDWIHFERGSVRESYRVSTEGVEQVFVVNGSGAGEIVVRMNVTTDLIGKSRPDGLWFETPRLGSVHYANAVAFDRTGKRTAVATELHGTMIELRVPAEFVATARFPVTIDPLIKTVAVETSPADTILADVAIHDSLGQALVCYEYVYTQANHGVFVQRFDLLAGGLIGSPVEVGSGTENWRNPKIAYNEAADVFLLVAEVGFSSSRVIRGRTLTGVTSFPGTPFTISDGTAVADSTAPDVGGDPNPLGATYFCVAWETAYNVTDHDIWARLVTPSGALVGVAPLAVDNSTLHDRTPCVSKTNGRPPASSQAWTIVWDRTLSLFSSDVLGRQLTASQAFLGPTFPIDGNSGYAAVPSVSSLTDESTGARRYLVTWANDYVIGDTDVFGVVMSGSSPLSPITNLSELQTPGDSENQILPATDSDGFRFVVASSESYLGSTTDYDIYVGTLHFDPASGTIGVTEAHRNLAYSGTRENTPQVAAVRISGSNPAVDPTRYAVVWDDEVAANNHDVEGAIYEGTTGDGGHSIIATTCGASWPTITAGGIPALGNTVTYTLTTGGLGWPLMLVGTYSQYPLCPAPCSLGVYPLWILATPYIEGVIPADPLFIGTEIYVQGLEVLPSPPLGCPLPVMPSATIRTRIE